MSGEYLMKIIQPFLDGILTLEIKVDEFLEDFTSAYQNIKLAQTKIFGKILLLDNEIQLAELDEFIYHEMFCFPPLFSHPNPQSVLIIGGGDLLLAKQVLKYPNIKSVDLIEIDSDVIRICKKHFKHLVKDVVKNPKLNLVIADGYKFVENSKKTYDVIFIDLTEDKEICDSIYTEEFFEMIKIKSLKEGGILAAQSGYGECFYYSEKLEKLNLVSSFYNDKVEFQFYLTFKDLFQHVHQYSQHVPTFFGTWSFSLGSDAINFEEVTTNTIQNRYNSLKGERTLYYSPEYHQHIYIKPKLIRELYNRMQ